MANANTKYGLKWVGRLDGDMRGQLFRCNIPASDGTATFINDPVKLHGSADADGVMTVIRADATDTPFGVIVGFEPNAADLSVKHRAASTSRYCLVRPVTKEDIFEIQEDGVGGALAATSVGLNADLISATGSTVSGLSGYQLDSSTAATTNTLGWTIVGFVRRPDNEIGTNAKVLVICNQTQLADQIAGV